MWTKSQIGAFQRALAAAKKHDATIAALEKIAEHAPAFAERVAELRVMRDMLETLAQTAIAVDPSGS